MTEGDLDEAILRARGQEAVERRDWASALGHWAVFHLLHPDRVEGYHQVGESLWWMHRFDAADDVLARGIARFPGNEPLLVSSAWSQMEKRDFPAATERFARALQQVPQSTSARIGMASATKELGRFAEAEAIILEHPGRDTDLPCRLLLADLARRLGKHALGTERWGSLVADQPDEARYHIELVECLRGAGRAHDAEAALLRAAELFPEDPHFPRSLAHQAEHAGAWTQALQRWEAFKTLFGSLPDGYVGAAHCLIQLGRYGDADVLLQPAVRLFAQNLVVASMYADVATKAGRWTDAIARWRAVQKLAPDRPAGFLGELNVLRSQGDNEPPLMASMLERFPDDPEVLSQHASIAQHMHRWPEAVERWALVAQRDPSTALPHLEIVRCFRSAGDLAAAERAVTTGLAAFHGDPPLLQQQAEIADQRQDWDLAAQRWSELVKAAPDFAPGIIGFASYRQRQGDRAGMFAVLEEAAPRFSHDRYFGLHHANLLSDLRDWPRAIPLWAALHTLAGEDLGLRQQIARAMAMAVHDRDLTMAETPGGSPPFDIPDALLRDEAAEAGEREATRALLMRFESLGDSCEFGIVQRRFGAEPLSLLRWTGTSPELLTAAFRARLEGVGDPEFTELRVHHNEYQTSDRRFHMLAHTFTMEWTTPFDKFYESQCKRMEFLRRKLLEDIRNSEKIFVYGSARMTDELALELYESMREIGVDVKLLCLRLPGIGLPASSVRQLRGGLMIGAIDRFSTVDTAVEDWLEVCRLARDEIYGTLDELKARSLGVVAE